MSFRSSPFLLAVVGLFLSACGARPALADEAARVRHAVETVIPPVMAQHGVPGMAVGVVIQGQAYVVNFGVASKASGTPVSDETLFEIGSVSKTLTATLGAYASATGALSLDQHPGQFVPEVRGSALDQASLLNLATYTAGGLPLQFPDEVQGQKAMLAYYRSWTPASPPSTRRQYSNPSLGLFGLAASNALGMDFARAMTSIVFPAFGMTRTFIHVPDRAVPDYAWGYRGDQAVHVNPGPMDEQTYGVKSTAADMLRFVQANIDPSGLGAAMRQAVSMTHVGFFRAGPLVQGLGWEQYTYPVSRDSLLGGNSTEFALKAQPVQRILDDAGGGPRLFNKTGSTGGFGAYVLFVPTEKIGIVLLANKNYPVLARVEAAQAILSALTASQQLVRK